MEQSLGSPDNATIGFAAKFNLWRKWQFYTQVLIDDLNISELQAKTDYWANRYGLQAGIKGIHLLGIPWLDGQVEYNRIRPYVYQHFNIASAHTHYFQSLGHPYGGNLTEYHLILRYRPAGAWHARLRYTSRQQGVDGVDENYGSNPNISTSQHRFAEYGVLQNQGRLLKTRSLTGHLSYQLWGLDAWLELEGGWRDEGGIQSAFGMGGLRMALVKGK